MVALIPVKPGRFNHPRLFVLVPLLFGLASCSRADVVPDLPGLRKEIGRSTPEVVKVLAESGEARSYLAKLHPGALYYLATSLAGQKLWADARVLYAEQLAQEHPVWKLPAWRGWLDCLVALKDWGTIIEQAPAILQNLRVGLGALSDDPGLAEEWRIATEAAYRARVTAAAQLRDATLFQKTVADAQVWFASTAAKPLGIGDTSVPAWLLREVAMAWFRGQAGAPLTMTPAFRGAVLPYLLGLEARDGQGDIAWYLEGGDLPEGKTPPALDAQLGLVRELARAKDLLARNQAVAAWDIYRGFVAWPGAKKAELAEVRLKQDLLLALHRQAGIVPLFLARDMYNAARLAGRLSDGISALDSLQAVLLQAEPAWNRSPLPVYLDELKGRLAKARDDQPKAQAWFAEGYALARKLETDGILAKADRQRLQWYLLGSLIDRADDQTGPLFDLDAVLVLARATDDPDYFNDLFEAAVLKIGARSDWAALARWDAAMAETMAPLLRHRCALLLARSTQLAKGAKAEEDSRFQAMTGRLLAQTESLYYREVALWMLGQPAKLEALLPSLVPADRYAGAAAEPADVLALTWSETMAEGYCTMGMYDQGMAFLWDHRAVIGLAEFAHLGRRFVEAGRYRQGLRILDSARVRGGHPPDRDLLAAYYPRPFASDMAAATANGLVPEWLMYALVRTESNFDTGAQSGPGARGLSQLMPATARMVAKGLKLEAADLDDPAVNLRLGTTFLSDQWRGQGQWPQALAAYNAGSGRLRGWSRAGLSMDPIIFSELIPFPETRNYVRRIVEASTVYAWLYYGQDAGSVLSILYTPALTYRQ